jgi:hypothetical protein
MVAYTSVFRAVADFSSAITQGRRLGDTFAYAKKQADLAGVGGSGMATKVLAAAKGTSKALQDTGKSLTLGVSVPLALVAGAAIRTYAQFEQQIVSAGSKAGASAEQLDRMKQTALDVGASTKFSATQAAQGLDNLTAAGFTAEEAIAALEPVTKGAQAANEDLGLAASLTARTMNAFNLPASKAGHVVDVLAQASNTTAIDMHGLQDAMGQAGEVGARFGQSLEDTVAIVGRLVDMGVPAASAGTAVRQALTSLSAPTSKANTLLDDLGIAVYDAAGNMRPLPDLVRAVQDGLSASNPAMEKYRSVLGLSSDQLKEWGKQNGISTTQAREIQTALEKGTQSFQNYATKTLFGVEGAKAFTLAMSDGKPLLIDTAKETDKLDQLTRGLAVTMGDTAAKAFVRAHTSAGQFSATGADAVLAVSALGVASDGTAEKIGQLMQQTAAQKLDNLKGSAETLAITMVDKVAPSIKSVVDWLTGAVNAASKFADTHPQVTKWGIALGGIAIAAGPSLIIVGRMIESVGLLGGALKTGQTVVQNAGKKLIDYAANAETAGSRVRTLASGAGRFVSFLGGPWGIAIGIAITVLGGLALAHKHAQDKAKAFTDTLSFQNGVLDGNSRSLVANKLANDGVLDVVAKAGIAEADFITALQSGGPTRDAMVRQLDAIVAAHTRQIDSGHGSIDVLDSQGAAAKKARDDLVTFGGELDASAGHQKQAADAAKGHADQQLNLSSQERAAKYAAQQQADGLKELNTAQDQAKGAADRLKAAIKAVVDKFTIFRKGALDSETANLNLEAAMDGLTTSVKTNGKSLSAHTAAGRANRTAVRDAMGAINDKITADFKATVKTQGLKVATDKASTSLKQQEKDLRKAAKAAGFSKDEIDKMIKKMLLTPKELKTKVKTENVKKAGDEVDKFGKKVKDVKDRNAKLGLGIKFSADKLAKSLIHGNYFNNPGSFARGTIVPGQLSKGARSDTVPAMLTPGEGVIQKPSVAYYGRKAVSDFNDRKIPRELVQNYAQGGVVTRHINEKFGVFGPVGRPQGAVDSAMRGVKKGTNKWMKGYAGRLESALVKANKKRIAAEKAAAAAAAKAARAAKGGNLGGAGGSKMSGSIHAIASRLGGGWAPHTDPQGGRAVDIASSGARNNRIAAAMVANHARLGLRYVISQMRIASARSSWHWRRYHPISSSGDFRHMGHVHVSYNRGTDKARRGFAWTGEKAAELVLNPQVRQYKGSEIVLNPQRTKNGLALLSRLESANLGPALASLAAAPSSAASAAASPAAAGRNVTFTMPIYYPKIDELPTRAAQRQLAKVGSRAARRTNG